MNDWKEEAIRLSKAGGWSWRGIAVCLGIPKSTVSDLLRLHHKGYIRPSKKSPQTTSKIEKDAPKVKFHDAVDVAENSIPVGVYSKLLNINNLDQNKLFSWFRDNGYLMDGGRRHNTPKQMYIDQGLFEVGVRTVTKTNGERMVIFTTLITGKGQIYFEKLLNGYK